MLALRRAAISTWNRGFHVGAVRISCSGLDRCISESTSAPQKEQQLNPTGVPAPLGFASPILANRLQNLRQFSSHASAKASCGHAETNDGFPEVEASTQIGDTQEHGDGVVDDSVSEAIDNIQDLCYTELDAREKAGLEKKPHSELADALINAPATTTVSSVLDKLVEGGYNFNHGGISVAMANLRRRRLYAKALQLSEWVEVKKCMDLVEKHYVCRLDLIAKVQGLDKAEEYIKKIPQEFQTEAVYNTLLANCVLVRNLKKAEEVFSKIRGLGLPLNVFACNQLLQIYKWRNKEKIAVILVLMEKENIKPTLFTFMVLMDVEGRSNDIKSMEQTVEHMKSFGVEPDLNFQARMAQHYIFAGCKDKAESILREMEENCTKDNRTVCRLVLPLYASLGKEEDVTRLWTTCEENPRVQECVAGIIAWGELGRLDKAEAVFEIMHKSCKMLSAKYYNVLLKVYGKSGNLTKGKELLRRMSADGCKIGPTTWDVLVRTYLAAGEIEKAESVLRKAREQSSQKPMYWSYLAILENYVKKGDIDNAENIFEKMRQVGYVGKIEMYQSLLEAYVVAKAPAYGFRERLKADNVFPGNDITKKLKTVDSFKKSRVVEILE